jgi:hypothetical protein
MANRQRENVNQFFGAIAEDMGAQQLAGFLFDEDLGAGTFLPDTP